MPMNPLGKGPAGRQPSFQRALQLDTYKGEIRARSWPRPRGEANTQDIAARQNRFRAVQKAARYFPPQCMVDIWNATQGTPLLPRDIVTTLLYNRVAYFELPTGEKLYPMMIPTKVSEALDALSQTPGDILIRTPAGWAGIPFDPSGGGGLEIAQLAPRPTTVATSTNATKGTSFFAMADIEISRVFCFPSATAGATYRAAIYALTADNVVSEILALSQPITTTASGFRLIAFDCTATLLKGGRYAICCQRVGAGGTPGMPMRFGPSSTAQFTGLPVTDLRVVSVPDENPATGTAFGSGTDVYEIAMVGAATY